MSQSQRDYQPKFSEQVKPVRVHDNLGFNNAKTRSASSNQCDYQPKLADRVASITIWDNIVASYRLNDAAHEWYETLTTRLYTQQFFDCMTQQCFFFSTVENEHCDGLLIVQVDGFSFSVTTEFENRVQRALDGLKLGIIKCENFDFLGLSVATYSDS